MRIATLQFAPKLGEVSANIENATTLLNSSSRPSLKNNNNVDLLVLPELAFTGYNFPSLAAIRPFLEPTCSGPSTAWAKATAAQWNCIVSVGYPELCTSSAPGLSSSSSSSSSNGAAAGLSAAAVTADDGSVIAYNSTVTVSPDGQILAHYRKTHLYYTDETWAKEGPAGFTTTTLKFPGCCCCWSTTAAAAAHMKEEEEEEEEERRVAWGICMDLNPYKFTAPWDKYEFSTAAIASDADMVVVSTAWLSSLSAMELRVAAKLPDMSTFSYWAERLMPLIQRLEKEVVVVVANRCGEEPGGTDHMRREGVRYAGSSWVGKVGRGRIMVWKMLGRAEEGILVTDLKDALPEHTFEFGLRGEEEDIDNSEEADEGVDNG